MKNPSSQHDIDLIIGKLLRVGVIVSCAITIFGGILYLFQHQGAVSGYGAVEKAADFHGAAEYLREIGSIVPRIFHLDGAAIAQFGIIVLIFTPIMRVLFSLLSFIVEKDKLYIVITLIVLLIIFANLFFGLR
ncbi:MAG: DUF1634 domain-containing protein [Dysgonamonadaceae bacterium]|jgi:uncharacterized membrane protein|nr:DUF1634 domain-containing protein [Dysgonamonadaceae bacterium]